MAKKDSALANFDKDLSKLNALIEKMEQGQLSLDDALKEFEAGIKLIRQCQHALTTAEQKVQILMDANDPDSLTDFDNDDG